MDWWIHTLDLIVKWIHTLDLIDKWMVIVASGKHFYSAYSNRRGWLFCSRWLLRTALQCFEPGFDGKKISKIAKDNRWTQFGLCLWYNNTLWLKINNRSVCYKWKRSDSWEVLGIYSNRAWCNHSKQIAAVSFR